jgi:hypothetical protein
MKKNSLLLAVILIQLNLAIAQNSSVGLSIGYGLPLGSQLMYTNYTSTSTSTSSTVQENGVYGTYGTGFVAAGSYEYFFNKVVGIDATIQYLASNKYEGSYYSVYNSTQGTNRKNVSYSRGFFFNPSVILTTDKKGIKPYLKAGFSVGHIVVFEDIESFPPPNSSNLTTSMLKRELVGGVPFGITGAIGFDIPIADKFNFFTELNFLSMSYFPTRFEYTAYTAAGVNMIDKLPENVRKGVFKKEITSTGSPSDPNEKISQSLPMGSIRLSLGVKMKLGNN